MRNIIDSDFLAYPYGLYNDEFINVAKNNEIKLGFLFKKPHHRARQEHDDFYIPRIKIVKTTPKWRFKLALKYGFLQEDNLLLK